MKETTFSQLSTSISSVLVEQHLLKNILPLDARTVPLLRQHCISKCMVLLNKFAFSTKFKIGYFGKN